MVVDIHANDRLSSNFSYYVRTETPFISDHPRWTRQAAQLRRYARGIDAQNDPNKKQPTPRRTTTYCAGFTDACFEGEAVKKAKNRGILCRRHTVSWLGLDESRIALLRTTLSCFCHARNIETCECSFYKVIG